MSEEKRIELFCKWPTSENFLRLRSDVRAFFYLLSFHALKDSQIPIRKKMIARIIKEFVHSSMLNQALIAFNMVRNQKTETRLSIHTDTRYSRREPAPFWKRYSQGESAAKRYTLVKPKNPKVIFSANYGEKVDRYKLESKLNKLPYGIERMVVVTNWYDSRLRKRKSRAYLIFPDERKNKIIP